MRPLRLLCTICGVVVVLYIAGFVWCFDIFSSPVRDEHGWLGPLIRGDVRVHDIGKTYFRDDADISYYKMFFPLCKLWLVAQGLG